MGYDKSMTGDTDSKSLYPWRSFLLKLPDEKFLSLIKNYIGRVDTPYNKHDLISGIEKFLQSNDIRDRIIGLLDSDDRYILSAVYYAGEPDKDDLLQFISEKYGTIRAARIIKNLQERLLIYQNPETQIVSFNPILQNDILNYAVSLENLFPGKEAYPQEKGSLKSGDSFLGAVLSYLLDSPSVVKAKGSMRKKSELEVKEIFGGTPAIFLDTLYALQNLGLCTLQQTGTAVRLDNWKKFADFEEEKRNTLFSFVYAAEKSHNSEQSLYSGFRVFINILSGRSYPKQVLKEILDFCMLLYVGELNFKSIIFISRLIDIEVLVPNNPSPRDTEIYYSLHPDFPSSRGKKHRKRVTIQPNFEIIIDPELSLKTVLPACAAAKITRYDVYPHYELTKNSFSRAAEHYPPGDIIDALAELNGGALPVNIQSTMEQWRREIEGISIHRGTVLLADEERRLLVEHSRPLQKYLIKILAPGVYLLDERSPGKLKKALQASGIDMPGSAVPETDASSSFPAENIPKIDIALPQFKKPSRGEVSNRTRQDISRELQKKLDASEFPEGIASRFAQRVRDKLILIPEQIDADRIDPEANEAKGLNYLGKVRLIEKALNTESSLLEVVFRGKGGVPNRLVFHPVKVYTSGNNLYVSGISSEDGREVNLAVSKLFLIRDIGFS